MSRSSRSLFQTIHSEGGLLPADLLQRVAQGARDLGGVRAEDYHLTDLPLNEAIVRSWNRLVGAWAHFRDARAALSDDDPGTTITRERWLLVLFDELSYGRLQAVRAVEIDGKPYPVSHAWEHVPIHLVGLCAKSDDGRDVTGSAASVDCPPRERAYFELLERASLLDAVMGRSARLSVLDERGQNAGHSAHEAVFPLAPPDASFRYALSNGVANRSDAALEYEYVLAPAEAAAAVADDPCGPASCNSRGSPATVATLARSA